MNAFTITWRMVMTEDHRYTETYFIDASNASSIDEISREDLVRLSEQLNEFLSSTDGGRSQLPELVPADEYEELENDDISSCDDFLAQYESGKKNLPEIKEKGGES